MKAPAAPGKTTFRQAENDQDSMVHYSRIMVHYSRIMVHYNTRYGTTGIVSMEILLNLTYFWDMLLALRSGEQPMSVAMRLESTE